MEIQKIYWKIAVEMIKKESVLKQEEINFNNEKIPIKDELFLNQKGYRVPMELVEYDDDNLDYSDNLPVNDMDIKSGRLEQIFTAEIPVKPEIAEWMKKSDIDFNVLVTHLVNNFYQTLKQFSKKAAL